jgi:hypothetical protein
MAGIDDLIPPDDPRFEGAQFISQWAGRSAGQLKPVSDRSNRTNTRSARECGVGYSPIDRRN